MKDYILYFLIRIFLHITILEHLKIDRLVGRSLLKLLVLPFIIPFISRT